MKGIRVPTVKHMVCIYRNMYISGYAAVSIVYGIIYLLILLCLEYNVFMCYSTKFFGITSRCLLLITMHGIHNS